MTWYRVFGTSDVTPRPEALLQHLRAFGLDVTGRFQADDQGWYRAVLLLAGNPAPVELERFLSTEEGIRAELNSWAGWVEAQGDTPAHISLMQDFISTRQLITLHSPAGPPHADQLHQLCALACQSLARETSGVYQIDDRGFFSADGRALIPEE